MDEDKLRELLNEMTGREPGTFKYSESSWTKDKLIDFILTCQGISKPRKKGGNYFSITFGRHIDALSISNNISA